MEDRSEVKPYSQKLVEVRQLPAEGEQDRKFKKEAARDLRIETYLSWAHVADTLVNTLMNDPTISKDELQEVANREKSIIPKPEVADAFLNSLIRDRNKSLGAVRLFRFRAKLRKTSEEVLDWPKAEKEQVGRLLFKELTRKEPQGVVSLMDTTIAVGIELGEEDFEALNPRVNVAGFYLETESVKVGQFRDIDFTFPFIGVKRGVGQDRVVRHELAHAVNSSVIQALILGGPDTRLYEWVWGGDAYIRPQKIKSLDELSSYLRKKTLPYALARAKNEIIADYGATSDFSYVYDLILRHGIYDYFDERIRFLRNEGLLDVRQVEVDAVVNGFWLEYTDLVWKAGKMAKDINKIYGVYELEMRRRLFKYVLAQIPMADWSKVLERDFLSEARAFERSQWRAIDLAAKARVHAGSEFEGTVIQGQVKRATLIAIEDAAYVIKKQGKKRARSQWMNSLFPLSEEIERKIEYLTFKYDEIKES